MRCRELLSTEFDRCVMCFVAEIVVASNSVDGPWLWAMAVIAEKYCAEMITM